MSDTVQTFTSFPSDYYYDEARYSAEIETIWYNSWLYLCRAGSIATPRAYRTFTIGNQNIIILRDDEGKAQAFHNTCRHRGSMLCTEASGELATRSLVCPYHQWSYNLQGKLTGVPFIGSPDKLGQGDLSLYDISLVEWGGCIFVNLAPDPIPFADSVDPGVEALANWPLDEIAVGHAIEMQLNCNWKIFWENFQECYHCPGIHPELCDMVPLYKRAVTGRAAARKLAEAAESDADIPHVGMKKGAQTWSMDGRITGQPFHRLTEEEQQIGYKYLTGLPNWFMAAHPDYVRLVSMFPTGPETMMLRSEWLFPAETLAHPEFDMMNVVDFGRIVLEQDGAACDLNQLGLHSNRHEGGILMPQEEDVYQFQQWIRAQMGEPLGAPIEDEPEGWQDY